MIKEIVSYQTSDGKVFLDKKEAEIRQQLIDGEVVYRVDYGYNLESYGFVYIKKRTSSISSLYNLMIEDWCHKHLGNKVIWAITTPVIAWQFSQLANIPDKEAFKNFVMAEL